MAVRKKKRIKVLGSVIKRDEHALVAEKNDMNRAQNLLQQHELELKVADDEVKSVEQTMRDCVDENGRLSLHALQQARSYLPEAQRRHRQATETRSRSEVAVDQTIKAVARRKAGIRATEKARNRLSDEQRLDEARDAAKESDEMWLQRWERPE